ncbi:MAG TPA: dihydroorotase [Spirochaetia bacterium]|nr:MAG: hypothetical protein A2Y41_09700 [Spirochaetes bacterium GWB1_36_13]HCL56554.1 dihydroorotase [Spirochaetia bacterium]
MRVLIKNITILDPFSSRKKKKASLLLENGRIESISDTSKEFRSFKVDCVIDGKDRVLFPGLIDLHTHLRDPGFEYKEDIASGSLAALHGGYTTITSFPNTNPVLDSLETLNLLQEKINQNAFVRVLPVAAVTKGLKGKELTDFEALKNAGAVAFTDDGKGIQDPLLMQQAMLRSKKLTIPLLLHTEDESLTEGGVIHKGNKALELGVPGIPYEAEDAMTARDIILAKKTGARVHFCHVSTRFSAKLIQLAKKEGIPVTAEVSPHHLCFTEDMIESLLDADKKMNPPLRTQKDTEALLKALKKGIIDVIATDHAPHSREEKKKGLLAAPFGITGLETALPLIYTSLIRTKKISFFKIIEALTKKPADILGVNYYPIREKMPLNFVIFNRIKKTTLTPEFFYSKSINFPLIGKEIKGKIEYVFFNNKMTDFRQNQYRTTVF